MSDEPLIELSGVSRRFEGEFGSLTVLQEVDLKINRGEFIAIIGASGSGKSTLMNIIGCLDTPSSGQYLISGNDVGALAIDDLARIRREHIGFIFQRYNLLSALDALSNVKMPAIYAGHHGDYGEQTARRLLDRLGMGSRLRHRPAQLSGGQQQRIAIARALINNPDVILADEPTGALDSRSGEDVLAILRELHAEGRTVVIVTHDPAVASIADRIIELRDGKIVADNRPNTSLAALQSSEGRSQDGSKSRTDQFLASFAMALRSMNAHRMRSFLTMLGIIIGTASVVCVVGLGQGTEKRILEQIQELGTNAIYVRPGQGAGDLRSAKIETLTVEDSQALAQLPFVEASTPTIGTTATARTPNASIGVTVTGAGVDYFATRNQTLVEGRYFSQRAIDELSQEVVIDVAGKTSLFPNVGDSVVGRVILIGDVPVEVIGVTESKRSGSGGAFNIELVLPYSTVETRLKGAGGLSSIIVRVGEQADMRWAESSIAGLLENRHGTKDFYLFNTDSIQVAARSASSTFSLLIGSIAAIALLVGGIGVMNIMLVSVSERITEIGLRMAVGARRSDIMQQFLVEAVVICLIGGALGLLIARVFGLVFENTTTSFEMIFSPSAMITAFVCSTFVGLTFGFFPARNAANLDPAAALSRE